MGLINLKNVTVHTSAPTMRSRTARAGVDREEIYGEFRGLIEAAKGQAEETGNPLAWVSVRIEGPQACNSVMNGLQAMWDDHPSERACLWTKENYGADGTPVKGSGTIHSLLLCAAARPTESGKARAAKRAAKREQGFTGAIDDSEEREPVDPGVTVRKAPGLVG